MNYVFFLFGLTLLKVHINAHSGRDSVMKRALKLRFIDPMTLFVLIVEAEISDLKIR